MVVILLVTNSAVVWLARKSHGGTWLFAAQSSGQLFMWVINMLQVVAQVAALATARTPATLRFVFRMVSFVLAEFSTDSDNDCGPTQYRTSAIAVFSTMISLSVFWEVLSLVRLWHSRVDKLVYFFGVAILLLVPVEIRFFLRLYDCSASSNGGTALAADPTVSCSSIEFEELHTLGNVSVAISVVGVFLLILLIAIEPRDSASSRADEVAHTFRRILTQGELRPSHAWLRIVETAVVTSTTVAAVMTEGETEEVTLLLRSSLLAAAYWAIGATILASDPFVPIATWKRPVKAGSYLLAGFLAILFACEDARERNPESEALEVSVTVLQIAAFGLSCLLVLTLIVSYYFHLLIKIHLQSIMRKRRSDHRSSPANETMVRVTLSDLWRVISREACTCRLARSVSGTAPMGPADLVSGRDDVDFLVDLIPSAAILLNEDPAANEPRLSPAATTDTSTPVRPVLSLSTPVITSSSGNAPSVQNPMFILRGSVQQVQGDRRQSIGSKLLRRTDW